jgi:hypothetical protein
MNEATGAKPMDSAYTLRPATKGDIDFLAEMTLEAFNWDPERPAVTMSQLRADPTLRKYIEGWPTTGEQGMVAETADGEPVGAAWPRRCPS